LSGELIAILAVGVTLLGVMLGALVPILLSINGRLLSLGERVARIEGALSAPYPSRLPADAGAIAERGERYQAADK
jgi:hypothetical protein